MKRTLPPELLAQLSQPLRPAHERFQARYPGMPAEFQPVHTYYAGAHQFRADLAPELGVLALRSLDEYAPDFISFAKAAGFPGAEKLPDPTHAKGLAETIAANPDKARHENRAGWLAHTAYARMREKLLTVPVEDLRIDFEDGYGNRPDAQEDQHAINAAEGIATALERGELPPSIGMRAKPFTEEVRERSLRTIDILLTALVSAARSRFPGRFYINLAKVTVPEEVAALALACEHLEKRLGLAGGTLRIEIMVETAQSILNERGEVNLLPIVSAGKGRCVAAHFGTYDYTAGRNIAAAHQHMLHPACDFAREVMQVALAGTGVWLSDGGTNILPVPVHTSAGGEGTLGLQQSQENRASVHDAWKLHFSHVRHSLENGFYQGWDLHPAQLPTRYAAVYSFFLESFSPAAERLRSFLGKARAGAGAGGVADDAATGQALLNYVLRAVHCGAVTEFEAERLTGLTAVELRTPSFAMLLANRHASAF